MAIISHTFNSINLVGGEVVDTTFAYSSAQPYELKMTFRPCDNSIINWSVSIEMLLEAAKNGKAGQGDVFFTSGPNWFIELSNGKDVVILMYRSKHINEFIVDVRTKRYLDIKNWVPFTDDDLVKLIG